MKESWYSSKHSASLRWDKEGGENTLVLLQMGARLPPDSSTLKKGQTQPSPVHTQFRSLWQQHGARIRYQRSDNPEIVTYLKFLWHVKIWEGGVCEKNVVHPWARTLLRQWHALAGSLPMLEDRHFSKDSASALLYHSCYSCRVWWKALSQRRNWNNKSPFCVGSTLPPHPILWPISASEDTYKKEKYMRSTKQRALTALLADLTAMLLKLFTES